MLPAAITLADKLKIDKKIKAKITSVIFFINNAPFLSQLYHIYKLLKITLDFLKLKNYNLISEVHKVR